MITKQRGPNMIQNIASCLFFDFKLNAFIAMHLNDFLATPM